MFWNDRYANSDGYLFGEAPSAGLVAMADLLPPRSRVLCVADGEGRNSVYLASLGHTVTGFDPAPVAVERARELARRTGVTLDTHVAGIEDWDWSTPYDVVAGIFIQFSPPAERVKVFERMANAVRPGGLILLHGFAPRQVDYGTGGPGNRDHMYTLDMLRRAFADWPVQHAADYDADQASGSGHTGRAALIDFVAQKPT